MWRMAGSVEDDAIVAMSIALYVEDPSVSPVPESNTRRTLRILRSEPTRGRAVILDLEGSIGGYALLISFWSNELGGEVCVIDELYVQPAFRKQGHARALFRQLKIESSLWSPKPVALELEVTPQNRRAAEFYGRLGFAAIKNSRLRLLL